MMKINRVIAEYWMDRFKQSQEELGQIKAENERLLSEINSVQRERDFWQTRSVSE